MAKVHLTLQGKGGVGKTFVSSLIAQYLHENANSVRCLDTDPVNRTFSQYQAFPVTQLEIMDGSRVNERNFDQLMEMILTDEDTEHWVIDSGASSFIPLSNYLTENAAIPMLMDAQHEVMVHTVITGGQALMDTVQGFATLASQLEPEAGIIVWLNEYFGEVAMDGKPFEKMKVYNTHKDRVRGLITIKQQNPDTFGKDLEEILNRKLTFNEAIEGDEFALMAKQRLKVVQRDLFQQLSLVI